LLARDENLVGAGHAELFVASGHHLHGGEVRTAGLNVHIEPR
jgi:hypothetical protein